MLIDVTDDEHAMVRVHKLSKRFGGTQVLHDVSLTVRRGAVVCIIGPSGSGKTTLIRCINNLESPDAGLVLVDSKVVGFRVEENELHVSNRRELSDVLSDIGFVFQSFNLFPNMTARENIMLGPRRVKKVAKDEAGALADRLLAQVGLQGKGSRYPAQLSGGEQQRVSIARALAMEPKLILFDEPTSALDPEVSGDVLGVMRGLARGGMTMVIVTHEIMFAREVADEIVFMADGRIVEVGPPGELLALPREERTKAFLARVL
jgi:polar amino acid transport system ATP-binding protein